MFPPLPQHARSSKPSPAGGFKQTLQPRPPSLAAGGSALAKPVKKGTTPLTEPGIGVPETGPVSASTAHLHGLRQDEYKVFKQQAASGDMEIGVRTGNPSRLPHVGTESVPKPAGLYTKTAKGSAPAELHGLVALTGNEALPPGLGLTRGDEVGDHTKVLRHGATVHGDIDLKRVMKGGKPVSESEFRPKLNAALDAGSLQEHRPAENPAAGDKIQHGAHDAWDKRNDMSYAGGINAGPLPGVINFPSQGAPQVDYTTAAYHQRLGGEGQGGTYSAEAWQKGAARDKAVREQAAKVTKLPPLRANSVNPPG
ncbi:MAG: hypothetical protein ACJ768_16820 [Gaiellaceae bacterium]